MHIFFVFYLQLISIPWANWKLADRKSNKWAIFQTQTQRRVVKEKFCDALQPSGAIKHDIWTAQKMRSPHLSQKVIQHL